MANIEDLLSRWTRANLISGETADRIREFERDSTAARPDEPSTGSRPGALEAMLYLGLVVLGVGVFALIAQQWRDLETWARIAAIGAPTLIVFAVGAYLRLSPEPEMQRGSQAAWFVTLGLFAGFAAVLLDEFDLGFAHDDSSDAILAVASATFFLALALWVFSPSQVQVFGLAASAAFLGQGVGAWGDNQQVAGVTVFALGLAGLVLGAAGWLTPAAAVSVFFGFLTIAGPYEAGVGDGPILFELLAAAAACGVIALGVSRASFGTVLVGVGGAFIVLVTFVFEHFSDRIGAPTALMVSGGMLIAAVLLLAMYRSESRSRKAA